MWKNRSIFQKIFLGTLLLVLLTMLSYYSFIVYYEFKSNVENTYQESVDLSVKINQALRDYITQIDGTITSFYYDLYRNEDSALASLLKDQSEITLEERFKRKDDLETFFSQMFLMRGDFVGVYLYANADKHYIYSPYMIKKPDYLPLGSQWYEDTLKKNGKTHISINDVPDYIKYNKATIGFSRVIRDVADYGLVENTVVKLDFTMKNLDNLVDNYITNEMTTVLLVDEAGEIVYQRGAPMVLKGDENAVLAEVSATMDFQSENGERYVLVSNDQTVYEWKVVIATNKDYILQKTKDYFRFSVVIGVLLLLVAAIFSYFFARTIFKPIQRLKSGMRTMQEGDFDVRIEKQSNDELGHLIDDFNYMACRIQLLIKEKYEEELQKKEAQYKFLQAQIDPHFIFNTLQIISSMAIVNGMLEVEHVSNNLARLIRYSISGEQKIISIKEELNNVISYLEIQKIRFKNRLTYEIEVDSNIEERSIIKLVLQPIVENGIRHGLENSGRIGHIRIKGYQKEERIFIEIHDNGIGMTQEGVLELLKRINKPLRKDVPEKDRVSEEMEHKIRGNHVGLRNINLRLKMYYGEEFGLLIESKPLEGTVVTVCIRDTF